MTLALPLLLFLFAPTPTPVAITWPPPEQEVEGVTLTLETDSREFFQGERIPVHMKYGAVSAPFELSTSTYDRSGRLRDMQWSASRTTDGLAAIDPYEGVFEGGLSGGLTAGPDSVRIGESNTQTFDANEWLWLPGPGEYVLTVKSYRARPVLPADAGPRNFATVVNSAPLKISIRAATSADIQAVISRSRATIDGPLEYPDPLGDPPPPNRHAYKPRHRCRRAALSA